MENLGDIVTNTAQHGAKPFEPTYLNLEYIFQKILNFFSGASGSGSATGKATGASSGVAAFWAFLKILLLIFAFLFLAIIIYCIIRIFEIRAKEKEYEEHEIAEYARKQKELQEKFISDSSGVNKQWQSVLDHTFSKNEADWKIAIIEADIMLDELMEHLGFEGENLGEKLKSANQENFKHLTAAWEVHTMRNKIAHEGSNFQLNQHEAKRAITTYEQIFRDYGFA
jgi:large-conductance mechanosensitive channel